MDKRQDIYASLICTWKIKGTISLVLVISCITVLHQSYTHGHVVRVFTDFLNIDLVNSKIIYDKMDLKVCVSAMDFFYLAPLMIATFQTVKKLPKCINFQKNQQA